MTPTRLAFTKVEVPAETVDLDSIAGEIGRIARGLFVLHGALDRAGHGDEAALVAVLHDALDRRHKALELMLDADWPREEAA